MNRGMSRKLAMPLCTPVQGEDQQKSSGYVLGGDNGSVGVLGLGLLKGGETAQGLVCSRVTVAFIRDRPMKNDA